MASKLIPNTNTSDSERQPLLSSPSPLPQFADGHGSESESESLPPSASPPNANGDLDAGAVNKSKETKGRKWTRRDVVLYTFFTLLALALLAVFVKGFIDSDVEFDWNKALKSALGGGLSGAAAMVLQVLTLMPLRTIMNYQYRYGTSFQLTLHTLSAQGGPARYYAGLGAALVQGPLARFGDTAANAGILALLQGNRYLRNWPALLKTVFASAAAAAFRMILTPIDTLKTTLQTQGARGWLILRQRIKVSGIGSLWYGAFATAAATFVGHYPWFGTYNFLDTNLPRPTTPSLPLTLARRALIGFAASIVSDTASNSLRVVKTYRQVNEVEIGYLAAARDVVRKDGWKGLLGRGLRVRIVANGAQGIMFSVLWRWFLDIWDERTKKGIVEGF